jgi:hypothetical protein
MIRVAWVLGGIALGLLIAAQSQLAAAQSSVQVGIDVAGDGTTGVSAIENCTSVSRGDTFDVDIYIQNVELLSAWQTYFSYAPDKLEWVSADPKLFLQTEPGSRLLTLSDPYPNGVHFLGAADSSAARESGSGILARVTLKATAPGVASVSLPHSDYDGDGQFEKGVKLTVQGGGHPGDTSGDAIYDDDIFPAYVAIDTSCSEAPTPGPGQPPDPGDGQPSPTALSGSGNGDGGDGGNGDGDSVSVGGGSGDDGDPPSGDDGDNGSGDDSDGSAGDGDGENGGQGGNSADDGSDGLSTGLIIVLALLGAALITGIVLFAVRGFWRPAN